MNWTFQLTCDRIRPDDCVFNPVSKGASKKNFNVQLNNLQVYPSVLKVLTLDNMGFNNGNGGHSEKQFG